MVPTLAWRNIWRNRRRTWITLSSIALGLAVAIFFICLGNGVYTQMVNDAARTQAGHLTIEHPEYRRAPAVDYWVDDAEDLRRRVEKELEGVKRTKLLILGQGVAQTARNSIGAALVGVEPSTEEATSPLPEKVAEGRYLEDADEAMAVIGSDMARRLDLGLGKRLVITSNDADGNLVDGLFRVAGIFDTGQLEVDGYLVQVPIDELRKFYSMPQGSATQVGIILENHGAVMRKLDEAREMLRGEGVAVYSWEEVMPELATYIQLDEGSNLVFQAFLLLLILFTTFNTVLMSVIERSREFASLLALGTEPRMLKAQVVTEALFLGFLGCLLGAGLGLGVSLWTKSTGIDMTALMGENTEISGFAVSTVVHPEPNALIVLGPSALVFIATVLFSFLTMGRIRNDNIAGMLRAE
jgi:ABC-type lipoprotein release transport system permease subunit